MFFPSNTFELYGLNLVGAAAYSTFRGAIAGTLIGSSLILLMGLLTKNKTWYQSSLLLISVIIFGRMVSLVADGWAHAVLQPLAVEIFIAVVLYFASRQLDADSAEK